MDYQSGQSDKDIRGLERYVPTTLSKTLLVTIPAATISAFWLVLSNAESLAPGLNPLELKLLAVSIALAVGLLLSFLLVLNLCVIIYQKNHGRIFHWHNTHPQMSFKWLASNATFKHYVFLLFIFIMGVVLGVSF